MTRFAFVLALPLAFAAGCKSKAAAPDESAAGANTAARATSAGARTSIASDDDYVAAGTAMLGKMTAVFKADATDCDKLADDLTKLMSDNDFAASQAYEKAHPDVKKKFDAATKPQATELEAAATPAMTACQNNKKVTDALGKLGGE